MKSEGVHHRGVRYGLDHWIVICMARLARGSVGVSRSFHAYIPCIPCLLASPLLVHGSYTHGSHSDRSSCFLSFSAAPIETIPSRSPRQLSCLTCQEMRKTQKSLLKLHLMSPLIHLICMEPTSRSPYSLVPAQRVSATSDRLQSQQP